jgi:hypothetical protein
MRHDPAALVSAVASHGRRLDRLDRTSARLVVIGHLGRSVVGSSSSRPPSGVSAAVWARRDGPPGLGLRARRVADCLNRLSSWWQ